MPESSINADCGPPLFLSTPAALWEGVQHDLQADRVPRISVYPDQRRLIRDITRLGAYH